MRILASVTAALLLGTSVQAAIVINGSFEDGVAISSNGSLALSTSDFTSLPGWTILSDGVDLTGSYWAASDGSHSVDLAAGSAGGISQKINGLVVGGHYRMTFDLSGNPDGGGNPKRLLVSVTSGGPVLYKYMMTDANSATNMLYETLSYDFVAGSSNQMIQFRSLGNTPYGAVLDNVSISLVPEPATWGLMLVGFAMVGTISRRRARDHVSA